MTTQQWQLVGDIGGTNARFGAVTPASREPTPIATYRVADFPTFTDVLGMLMDDAAKAGFAKGRASQACLAVAAMPDQPVVSFTNSPWQFTKQLVESCTGISTVNIINDFAAVARALPVLEGETLIRIGGGNAAAGFPKLAIGPGTGLGVAALVDRGHGVPMVVAGEGGHIDFAPVTDTEAQVLKILRARFGRVSVERLCCGHGILNIYEALCQHRGEQPVYTNAASIGSAAQGEADTLAQETMGMFFAILGAAAGNFALTFGARGGVYIAGGIAPRYIDILRRSDFRARFLAKGRFADYLAEIPTFIITHKSIGLVGAALSLQE
jgi:glucokinase